MVSSIPFPQFRPRRPWVGADLQTLRNRLRPGTVPSGFPVAEIRLVAVAGGGDKLRVRVEAVRPDRVDKPLVLLVHGLTGCEDSHNIRTTARYFLDAGFPVARMNMRGAGPGAVHAERMYHAGLTDDLAAVLRDLDSHPLAGQGIVLFAVSLGANMALKYLAEAGDGAPVRAAVAVSAPIDLKPVQRRLEAARNKLYHRYLLHDMMAGLNRLPAMTRHLNAGELAGIRRIYDFDNRIVAPVHGFRDADHYYAAVSAGPVLGDIRVPTLLIHAADDPWIPACLYDDAPQTADLRKLIAPGGGHVGFHARDSRQPWHDRCARLFFEARM